MSALENLLKSLQALYFGLRNEMRDKWRRDLPFEELLFDRWERAQSLGFGDGASIYHNSYVYGDVKVGEGTWIGPYTLLDGSAGLSIGRYCSISAGVHIYTHDTVKWAVSGGKAEAEQAPVSIGDCCYVGAQTVIAKGVSIGDHSVIGANSFVNRSLPPLTIAIGAPCRAVGRVLVNEFGEVTLDFDEHPDSNTKNKT